MMLNEIYSQVTGVVLAGGQSRRFGSDKALASFEQTTMIAHVIALLKAVSNKVLVVTHPNRDYLGLDAQIIHDIHPDQGPLGGLYTACRYVTTPYLLVLTCDMPLLSPHAIFHLLHSHQKDVPASIYRVSNQWQPFPGLYAKHLAGKMKQHIARDQLSMKGFLQDIRGLAAITPTRKDSEFTNVNTQAQLRSL